MTKYKRESRLNYLWVIVALVGAISFHYLAVLFMLMFFGGMIIYNEQRD